jgi:hypothetical protein
MDIAEIFYDGNFLVGFKLDLMRFSKGFTFFSMVLGFTFAKGETFLSLPNVKPFISSYKAFNQKAPQTFICRAFQINTNFFYFTSVNSLIRFLAPAYLSMINST